MREYIKKRYSNFFEVLLNLLFFLPYYFSVSYTLKTFFSPWKKMVEKKNYRGFSFSEWFSVFSFNFFSRMIGVMMRSFLLFIYLIVFFIYLLFFLLVSLLSPLLLPYFVIGYLSKSGASSYEKEKKEFIAAHALSDSEKNVVGEWFDKIYYPQKKERRWRKERLFSIPPLARDWAAGYTPTLDKYALELGSQVYQEKVKNVLDRKKELSQIENILSQNSMSSVILVGEEGVGKHTVIDAFAKKIYEGRTLSELSYKRVLKLEMEKILSQFKDFQKKEEFLSKLLDEAAEAENIILFIENIERYAGNETGFIDISNVIVDYARRKRVQYIATTTPLLFQRYISRNESLKRLFEEVKIEEVSKEDAEEILLNVALKLEERHGVKIAWRTVRDAIEKCEYFVTEIPFPEKAIEILDYACVLAKQEGVKEPIVLPRDIDRALAEKTHKLVKVDDNLRKRVNTLPSILKKNLKGQDAALEEVGRLIKVGFMKLGQRKKPLVALLLLGPTGVGKTETAKIINSVIFPGKPLIRFDMSNFQTKEDIKKLIGDITTDAPGLLSLAIEKHVSGVLLLDEIEKANKDLINIFLSVLDEGYFTDGFGKKVDCKNLIIIATSNATSGELLNKNELSKYEFVDSLVERGIFLREFLNRFDEIIIYQFLSKDALREMALSELEKLRNEFNVKCSEFDNKDIDRIINSATSLKFGARYLKKELKERFEEKCV